jgi:putative tryptophan/tyrosine transport system substrate-binding protein
MLLGVKRREFMTLLGGAAAAWPPTARAQQPGERLRRVGILMPYPQTEQEMQGRVRAFKEELHRLGWIERSNIEFDERWTADNMELVRSSATSLVERNPDAIVALCGRVIPILKQTTRSVPLVVMTVDLIGTGMVTSLAHPGENITGFSVFELSMIGKFLALLKEIAPNVARVSLIFNPDNPATRFFQREFETAAPALAVEPAVAHIHGLEDIERAIARMAAAPNGGLLFAGDVTVTALRERIVPLVARSRLPAIYSEPAIVKSGGLASYSADRTDLFRRTAGYVDRILRGEKPGDLPVQQPTKFEFLVNLKTARTLGLELPDKLLALANEVIE